MQISFIYKSLEALPVSPTITLFWLALIFIFLVCLLGVIRSNKKTISMKKMSPIFTSAIPTSSVQSSSLANRSLEELLEIEESLLAVRELYLRKLIPVDVYVSESLKYSG